MELLHVDCGTCTVRGIACDGCMMSVLLGPVDSADHEFDSTEQTALAALSDHGLIPPLRLVEPTSDPLQALPAGPGETPSEPGIAYLLGRDPFADAERVV